MCDKLVLSCNILLCRVCLHALTATKAVEVEQHVAACKFVRQGNANAVQLVMYCKTVAFFACYDS